MPKLYDVVEDRSLMTGIGHIAYLRGNNVYVRYSDGSEEVVDAELLVRYDDDHWII
jgi:hypothetical protein